MKGYIRSFFEAVTPTDWAALGLGVGATALFLVAYVLVLLAAGGALSFTRVEVTEGPEETVTIGTGRRAHTEVIRKPVYVTRIAWHTWYYAGVVLVSAALVAVCGWYLW